MVGEWAWLHLLHRPIASLDVKGCGKLGPKFFGPFQVTKKIDNVAYSLPLPARARLHDVFHVGLVKKFHDEAPSNPGPFLRYDMAVCVPLCHYSTSLTGSRPAGTTGLVGRSDSSGRQLGTRS
jgi:hypothetical protein